MSRRSRSSMDLISTLPWQVGVVLGVVGYVGFRYGVGWGFSTFGGPLGDTIGKQLSTDTYAPIAWLWVGICCVAALISYFDDRRRKRLLDLQSSLESVRGLDWREFEMLVGEAFHRQGFDVLETGLGGPDGGIDLILRKNGAATLVQCKRWRSQRVDVKIVREMYGLMAHHRAAAGKIVTVGNFTEDAREFVRGKPIELVNGHALLAMVREYQTHSAHTFTAMPKGDEFSPICPICGSAMQAKSNRRTAKVFWGCARHPACRGARVG